MMQKVHTQFELGKLKQVSRHRHITQTVSQAASLADTSQIAYNACYTRL